MPDNSQLVQTQLQDDMKMSSGPIIVVGILSLMMGIFAMGSPLITALSLAVVVGSMLIVSGIGQLFFAFKAGKSLFAFIIGALTLAIGFWLVSHPGAALASFTLFLAMYLVISGAFEITMSFHIRPFPGWGWATFSGIVSILLGLMILKQFPLSGAWAIGILIGVRLFFNGLTLLMLGLAAKR